MDQSSPMIIFFAALLFLAVLLGLILAFRYRNFDPIDPLDRLIIAALPALDALIAIALFVIVKAQPLDLWNDVRLARTFAIYHGFALYPGADTTGPILGALHMPVSHLLFGPAVLAPSPTSAIFVACLIAVALIILPLIWLFCFPGFVRPRNLHSALFALTACGFLIITCGSFGGSTFKMVHTDAAAVGFAAIAAGILYSIRTPLTWRRLLLSALCATLSIGAKQTMFPLVVGLCLFLLVADGLRPTLRYVLCLITCGLAFAAFCLVLFRPARDFLFNTVTLATHRPGRGGGLFDFPVYKESLTPTLPWALCIAAFVLLWLFRNGSAKGLRGIFSEQRWLVFPIVGLLLVPSTIKARMTIGGAENHTAILSFFFFVGICLALLRYMREDAPPAYSLAAKMLAGIIIAFCIPGILEQIHSTLSKLHTQPNYEVVIQRYQVQHPDETTYFPCAPLATFYREKRFYDVDTMLVDREDGGRPISAAQLISAIPTNPQRVVVPEGLRLSRVLQDYLAGWTPGPDPELPGQIVYERPKAATITALAQ
jgi:hypothetical protein